MIEWLRLKLDSHIERMLWKGASRPTYEIAHPHSLEDVRLRLLSTLFLLSSSSWPWCTAADISETCFDRSRFAHDLTLCVEARGDAAVVVDRIRAVELE